MADVLVLGGTAWLGREVARAAVARGDAVTCLARGSAGYPDGVTQVVADRSRADAYAAVASRDWDAVVDVARQPGQVASAVEALGERVAHWTLVSTCSVYADASTAGADESAEVLAPFDGDEAPLEEYGAAKARCEQLVADALGSRALVARSGLIGGPGDPTDRFGYWVSRLALAGDEPVLVPDVPDLPTQTADVRDLASWLASAASDGVTGVVDAVAPVTPFGEVLDAAARVAGSTGRRVAASPSWLVDHEVQPWMGERSLPLWLPSGMEGMCGRSGQRARDAGWSCRPLAETLTDTLAWEQDQGLTRPRAAGLTRPDELTLLERLP
ncbi:NAD-dependent epimerase/dehydratase family protein [Solicola sp. PLA-1-18]|uniref:NAD-dependent epimerase/dehydratase family protein n=1 Tax=Solicola sp. PLA-1-18 TaxID=3380532 RepID=UPI003B767727